MNALILLAIVLLASCTPSIPPCDVRNPEMIAKAAECKLRVLRECANIPDAECPAVADCDRWGEERCGLGEGGAGQ
jgi:hypothetical protein